MGLAKQVCLLLIMLARFRIRAPGLIGLSHSPELVGFIEQGVRRTGSCVKRSDYRQATRKESSHWRAGKTQQRYNTARSNIRPASHVLNVTLCPYGLTVYKRKC